MRDLAEVQRQVLAAIPDETVRQELEEACTSTLQSYYYAAPEQVGAVWARWTTNLGAVLGSDREARPWLSDVQRIVNGG